MRWVPGTLPGADDLRELGEAWSCALCAGFTCSAGIAANKLLAKVGSALHKPNQQTIVPPRCRPPPGSSSHQA